MRRTAINPYESGGELAEVRQPAIRVLRLTMTMLFLSLTMAACVACYAAGYFQGWRDAGGNEPHSNMLKAEGELFRN